MLGSNGGDGRTVRAAFRVRLPEDAWIADVSRSHPAATYRLLAGTPTDDGAVELGAVTAADPEAAVEAVADHPATSEFALLEITDDTALSRYETADAGLYEFAEALSMPIDYPVVVEAGWFEVEVTTPEADLDRVEAALAAADLEYEVLSVVGDEPGSGLLTDRQREALAAGVRAGYFEVPRECTLAEVARRLDVDESTASGLVRRGQARVVKWYLTGSD